MMSATQITGGGADASQQRLVNVVEEMALASGVAVPEIFVLEHEAGINAFAAGTTHANAAICVTRGALERLDRARAARRDRARVQPRVERRHAAQPAADRALVRHPRAVARRALHSARPRLRAAEPQGGQSALAIAVVVGIALVVIGWIGVFLSRLIKAAVSRQREALADASAVQFTREPQGLAGALKKIAAYGARIQYAETEEVAHMLFERGSGAFGGWFATHPPLIERIKALDPSFDPRDFPKPSRCRDPAPRSRRERAIAAARAEGGFDAAARTAAAVSAALAAMPPSSDPVRERAGQIVAPDVGGSACATRSPRQIQEAARAQDSSLLLVAALAVAPDAPARDRQFALLEQQLGGDARAECRRLYDSSEPGGPAFAAHDRRARAAGAQTPARRADSLSARLARQARRARGRAATVRLRADPRARGPTCARSRPRQRPRRASRSPRARCATRCARCSRPSPLSATPTRRPRARRMPQGSPRSAGPTRATLRRSSRPPRRAISRSSTSALTALAGLRSAPKLKLLRGVLATIRADGKVELDEQELFRAIAATLDCPLPPGFAL